MKRTIGSMFLALVMILGLVPFTALAAESAPTTLLVGGTDVTEGGYWTTDKAGALTQATKQDPWNVSYDPDTATLTFNSATVKNTGGSGTGGAGVYALGQKGSNLSLTVELRGDSTLVGSYGIYLAAQDKEDPTLGLTLRGGGSLVSRGNQGAGIYIQTGKTGTGALTLDDNALVWARGGVKTDGSAGLNIGPAAKGGGILFDRKEGKVYGTVTLQRDLTLAQGETLSLAANASLNTGDRLTVDGGTLNGQVTGKVIYKVTGVTLDPKQLDLKQGENRELKATLAPANATNQNLKWSSSDQAVATVKDGTVTAVGEGQAVITVTTEDGEKTDTCTVTVAHAHHMVETAAAEPTCTQEGNTAYWYCDGCQKYFSDREGTKEITLQDTVRSPKGHTWGQPRWSWSADGKSCTATFTCASDSTHTKELKATVTSAVKTAATCQQKGTTLYTATVELEGKKYSDTKEVKDIPLADHVVQWEGDYPATCDRNGREGTATCVVCGKVLVEDKVIPAPGHKYGDPVWTWSKDGQSCTVTFTCTVCGHKETSKATVTTQTVTKPTCTQAGTGTRQAQVTFNGNKYTSTQGKVTLDALGHTYKNGKCTVCGQADPSAKPAATATITQGAKGTWNPGSTQGLGFTYTGEGKLAQVQVNGKALDTGSYTLQGTTVTLTPEYLETLDPGSYTLVIALDGASAKTTFTVAAQATSTPTATTQPTPTVTPQPEPESTGGGNMVLWIALGAGVVALAVLLLVFKPWVKR